jgi:L-lactate permease
MEVFPAILIAGGVFAGVEFLTSNYFNPMLP